LARKKTIPAGERTWWPLRGGSKDGSRHLRHADNADVAQDPNHEPASKWKATAHRTQKEFLLTVNRAPFLPRAAKRGQATTGEIGIGIKISRHSEPKNSSN